MLVANATLQDMNRLRDMHAGMGTVGMVVT